MELSCLHTTLHTQTHTHCCHIAKITTISTGTGTLHWGWSGRARFDKVMLQCWLFYSVVYLFCCVLLDLVYGFLDEDVLICSMMATSNSVNHSPFRYISALVRKKYMHTAKGRDQCSVISFTSTQNKTTQPNSTTLYFFSTKPPLILPPPPPPPGRVPD